VRDADVSAVDITGHTARDWAMELGMQRAIKALDGEKSQLHLYNDRWILL
jgi:hypothetical protein